MVFCEREVVGLVHIHANKNQTDHVAKSTKRRDDLTRVKVKLSVLARSSVKIKVALLASHNPDELVRLGARFTNAWIV